MKNYLIVLLLIVINCLHLQAQIITTIAGNPLGDTTDGIPATDALIGCTYLTIDNTGNIYFGGIYATRIKKVSTSGIITTIAGNGISGFSGDGEPATNASFMGLGGLSIDNLYNLYISDYQNNCIRKVNESGIITLFAGTPLTPGYSGDGGPATAATMTAPLGIATDRFGNIYFADWSNYVIRKVSGGVISTFAGNVYPAHSGDGGLATAAHLLFPKSIAIDTIGNVYIVENEYDTLSYVRMVNTSGIITTIAGNGTVGYSGDGRAATAAAFHNISGIAIDKGGNVILSDQGNNVIRVINTSGIVTTYAGNGAAGYSGDGGPANLAQLNGPRGIAMDTEDNLYIADANNGRIRKVSAPPASTFVQEVNTTLKSINIFPNPSTGAFTITLPAANDKITMNIEDITGRIMETKDITNNTAKQFNFNISQPPGTYIVKVIADGISYREKVIIW